jgi:hypothetical protein
VLRKALLPGLLLLSSLILLAFQRNSKNEVKKMDAKAKKGHYLVPDFYDMISRGSGDSLLVFECYDSSGKAIWQDASGFSFKAIYITYKRFYYDTTRMTEDSLYGEIPTREDRLIMEYFKWGNNAWLRKAAGSKLMDTLIEYRDQIVKRDTVRAYPGTLPASLYNLYYIDYYKTAKK